jgi:hypothetical protein
MVENIEIGNSFIVPTPPSRHLFIVIALIPEKPKEEWLMVNLTTSHTQIDPKKDCILDPANDLPNFINCRSTIVYREAIHYRKNIIIEEVKSGRWTQKETIPPQYVYEIQRIGASSKQLANKYRNILKKIIEDIEVGSGSLLKA